MKSKTILAGAFFTALALAIGWWVWSSPARIPSSGEDESVRQVSLATGGRQAERGSSRIKSERKAKRMEPTDRSQKTNKAKPPKPVLDLTDDDEDEVRTPAERALAARIEKALDEENLKLAVDCANEALRCPRKSIREAMVETLGWFGVKALPELTPFMADSDEDIRTDAQMEWSMALSEIEDDTEKISTVEMAMRVLTDEEMLDDISSEYIGVDEKLAVESLLRLIEGDGSEEGIAKAKETYEFVTGDEFTNRAAAEKWIAEEYDPPEASEESPVP